MDHEKEKILVTKRGEQIYLKKSISRDHIVSNSVRSYQSVL